MKYCFCCLANQSLKQGFSSQNALLLFNHRLPDYHGGRTQRAGAPLVCKKVNTWLYSGLPGGYEPS